MIDSSEQLLSDVIHALYDMFPYVNVESTKSKLSSVISKYIVQVNESDETQTDLYNKIEIYLSSKKLEGLSPITLENYQLGLTKFADSIKKKTVDITTADIRIYLSKQEHLKMSTMGTKLSILKSFFSWLHSEEYITRNPTAKLKPPKIERRMPKSLTIEQLELMRESCKTVRQRCFLEILYATGARLTECQQLNVLDIDLQNKSCRVIGKGNREREVYFSFKAIYHLKKYISSRKDECEALMATERKPYHRLSKRGIQREISIIGKNAGLKVSPHDLRRTFATLTLNNGAEITAVQELLGHQSPDVTLRYARITEERKREQHKKYLIQ